MSHKLTEEKITALKTHVQDHQHLDAGQKQHLHQEIDALEQRLQAQIPPDTAALETSLREWGSYMAAKHPMLASVVTDALQKLSAMGI